MRDERPRRHALLIPDLGPPGPPYLPLVGEIYWVMSLLYSPSDPAPARPAVVVFVPAVATPTARIRIVTRTSETVPGIAHPRDLANGLSYDGTFSELGSVLASSWRSGNVRPAGTLVEPFLGRVMEWSS